jgi:hypothetical protein
MNKENAKEFLPLVQALADGKTIQMRDVVSEKVTLWDDLDPSDIYFRAPPEEYRIKQEPRTFEMWLTPEGSLYPLNITPFSSWKTITVQEVLP